MAKLIRSATECGHRVFRHCLYFQHQDENSTKLLLCNPNNEQNFPNKCPLEDGMSYKEHLDRVLEMHKKPGTLYSTIHKCKQPRNSNKRNNAGAIL